MPNRKKSAALPKQDTLQNVLMACVNRELMACYLCKCMLPTSITQFQYLKHVQVTLPILLELLLMKASGSRWSTMIHLRLMWGMRSYILRRARHWTLIWSKSPPHLLNHLLVGVLLSSIIDWLDFMHLPQKCCVALLVYWIQVLPHLDWLYRR